MKKTIRIITRGANGQLKTKDFETSESVDELYEKIGVDDCSTDLTLRGLPVYRGLVGPMTEDKNTVRYESPEIFELMTKEWSNKKIKRRRRRKSEIEASDAATQPA